MASAKKAKTWRRVHIPHGAAPPEMIKSNCRCCGSKTWVINGAWLRWKRESARLDQRRFGVLLGVSGPYISDLENNRRDCPVEALRAYKMLKKDTGR